MLEIEVAGATWSVLESRVATREGFRHREVRFAEYLRVLRLERISQMVPLLLIHLELLDLLLQRSILLLNRVSDDLRDHLLVALELLGTWQLEGRLASARVCLLLLGLFRLWDGELGRSQLLTVAVLALPRC